MCSSINSTYYYYFFFFIKTKHERHIFNIFTLCSSLHVFPCFSTDADRAASISMFGGQHHLSSLHSSCIGDGGAASNFYPDDFAQQQHRHQVDGGLPYSSGYPTPAESQQPPLPPIRLQSPPHRLNNRTRNANRNQQYESGNYRASYNTISCIVIIVVYCAVHGCTSVAMLLFSRDRSTAAMYSIDFVVYT